MTRDARRSHDFTPLPLRSKRWLTLKAHFGNAGRDGDDVPAVPSLLRRWALAVGTYAEEYEYEPLLESYLHQSTILDVAYAVVPHLVLQLERLDPDRRVAVLDDLARVDAVRGTPRSRVEAAVRELASVHEDLRDLFIQNTRERCPELAADLAEAYLPAIAKAKRLAGTRWGKHRSEPVGPHRWRRHVRYLREQGLTDKGIAFGVRVLAREDDLGLAPIHLGGSAMTSALRAAADAAPDIRRLRLHTKRGHLVLDALATLAWIHRHAPVEKMLGTR